MHFRYRLQAAWIPCAPFFADAVTCRLTARDTDCAMSRIIDFAAPVGQKAGPGHWNDLDMLEIGNGGMSYDEYGLRLPCSLRRNFHSPISPQ